jgi:hypothetical protein
MCLSSWEGNLDGAAVKEVEPFAVVQPSSACDAWRARIETTLLMDLSEEERSSLAEHVKSCSACAGHFRKYQIIEEFAGELPYYDLLNCGIDAVHRRSWSEECPERRCPERRKKKHLTVVCGRGRKCGRMRGKEAGRQ